MLIQLHWINPATNETIAVAQTESLSYQEDMIWEQNIIKRRSNEKPEGWVHLVLTEHSKNFHKQPTTIEWHPNDNT